MTSPSAIPAYCLHQSGMNISFVPYQVPNRVNVQTLLEQDGSRRNAKWDATMKAASLYEQEVIIQDLLLFGREGKTEIERNATVLAAELFVKLDEEASKDFMLHLLSVPFLLKAFHTSVKANYIYHESLESNREGSSGLSNNELLIEKSLAGSRILEQLCGQ
jgi:hypothetical protein